MVKYGIKSAYYAVVCIKVVPNGRVRSNLDKYKFLNTMLDQVNDEEVIETVFDWIEIKVDEDSKLANSCS
jgi:hypothetical protein